MPESPFQTDPHTGDGRPTPPRKQEQARPSRVLSLPFDFRTVALALMDEPEYLTDTDLHFCFALILRGLGYDFREVEGLSLTPQRYIKALRELTTPEPFEFSTFTEACDEMVVVSGIPFYSLCEHHVLPFHGTATVGYIPGDCIVGLSKLARSVGYFARGLQTQERITNKVAQLVEQKLGTDNVAVVLRARHLCMEMRGVQSPGAETITSSMKGRFRTEPKARQEFFDIVNR